MRPIVTVVAWSVCLSVCWHVCEPRENGWTDRDAVWVWTRGKGTYGVIRGHAYTYLRSIFSIYSLGDNGDAASGCQLIVATCWSSNGYCCWWWIIITMCWLLWLMDFYIVTTAAWSFGRCASNTMCHAYCIVWLGSRVVSVLDSGAERTGFKSQPRRCRISVLGKLFTPIVPLFTKQQNW